MFGGQCFCATQHFVPPLNNHVVPKKCPGMHTDSMQIFNKLQIEENNLIFSSPNFAVVCFRCQTWFHYLQLKAFKRSRSNNLNLKKRNYFQRKTNPSFIRSGHNPSLLQLWTQLQSFPLVRQKGITFFFHHKNNQIDRQGYTRCFFTVPP